MLLSPLCKREGHMIVEEFLDNPTVTELLAEARPQIKDKQFSDIIDGDNHQYVDVVMEGGGILGIALLGFTYALEEFGIRFLGIGGTSAGSINALLLASLGSRNEAKSVKAIHILANLDLYSFVDGDEDAKDFVEALVEDAGTIRLGFKFVQVIDNLERKLGLNPGKVFLDWLSKVLADHGVTTTGELAALMNKVPAGFGHRNPTIELSEEQQRAYLAIIAAEITTETKVEFPKMAHLFWDDVNKVPPAIYARASMSIPFFFQPFKVSNIPNSLSHQEEWQKQELANYFGELPKTCTFIDGGIMSNFPIDVFHVPYTIPNAPTFGVKLGMNRHEPHPVTSPFKLAIGIFNSARHTLDYDFIKRNPDYRHLVSTIETGSHNWINFQLSQDAKIDLFVRGVRCATEFLKKFQWEKYKGIRADLAKAFRTEAS